MNKALPITGKTLVDDELLMHLLAMSPVSQRDSLTLDDDNDID